MSHQKSPALFYLCTIEKQCSSPPPPQTPRPAKSFFVSICATIWARVPGWWKSCLVAAGRGSGRSPGISGLPEGSLKACWAPEAPSCARGWAFLKHTGPAPPAGQSACEVSQVVAMFLMRFTSWPRKWLFRKSQRRASAHVELRARRSRRTWFRFFSRTTAISTVYRLLRHSSSDGFCTTGNRSLRQRPAHWLITSSRGSWALTLLLSQLGGSGACPPEPHRRGWKRSPQKGRCRRPADACWPGSWRQPPPPWNNSVKSGSCSRLIGNTEQSLKKIVLLDFGGRGWLKGGSQSCNWKRGWRVAGGCANGVKHRWSKREIRGRQGALPRKNVRIWELG